MEASHRRRPGRPRNGGLTAHRQEEIAAAATCVFAGRGYRETDVQVIADRLGVGKGTIYRYFPTKRDLFLATVDRGMRLLRTEIERRTADVDDPLDRIAEAVRGYLAFFDRHHDLVELLIQERAEFKNRKKPTYFAHRDASIGPWRQLFRDLIAQGRVRNTRVESITDVLSDALYGTIFTNYFSARRKSLERQGQDVLDVFFFGILGEEERRRHRRDLGIQGTDS